MHDLRLRFGWRRPLDLDADELGADGQHLAGFADAERDDTRDGGGDLDRRLVGHHVGEDRVGRDLIADLDVPLDQFGLGDAFADVGQLDPEHAHCCTLMTRGSGASPCRPDRGRGSTTTRGRAGYGVSQPHTRVIGASR